MKSRSAALALLAVTLAGALAACADPTAQRAAPSPSVKVDRSLHDRLPADVRSRGTLRVVTDASYAPASSFAKDGRTIIGFEPDLGAALGQVLGVRVVFADHDFDDLPMQLHTGRADLIMSAMTDTEKREQDLDFVDYFLAGTSIVVQRGNPKAVTDLRSLCGKPVSVERGTVQYDLLTREQPECGANPMKLVLTSTNDDALVQLRTGRVAAVPMDLPPAELLATASETSAHYQLATTEQYEPGPYGIGVVKSRVALRDVVRAALASLMRSGVYQRVLAKWHVESGAVHSADVNAAGN